MYVFFGKVCKSSKDFGSQSLIREELICLYIHALQYKYFLLKERKSFNLYHSLDFFVFACLNQNIICFAINHMGDLKNHKCEYVCQEITNYGLQCLMLVVWCECKRQFLCPTIGWCYPSIPNRFALNSELQCRSPVIRAH